MDFKVTTPLFAHQKSAVEKLWKVRVNGLYMGMGTGKSLTVLEMARLRQEKISKIIVFCPVSLKRNFYEQVSKHTTASAVIVNDRHNTVHDLPNVDIYIIGTESMSSSNRTVLIVRDLIDENSFVIVDESTDIKGHDSKRTLRLTHLCGITRYRTIMTGTPLTQGAVDLYAQMRFLSPKILGYRSFYSFAANHLEYSERFKGMISGYLGVDVLANKIAPYVYQVTKEECLDLPPKIYGNNYYFFLTEDQERDYGIVRYKLLEKIQMDDVRSIDIFECYTNLQKIVSGYNTVDGKLVEYADHRRIDSLLEAIESIPETEKVIIWCKYTYSVNKITQELGAENVALHYGEMSEKQKDKSIAEFRTNKRFFVSTQMTAGRGLTLNEANHVIFYEHTFKYADRLQSEDRCHRIGQEKPVVYLNIYSYSGIENKIRECLEKKGDLLADFVDEIAGLNNMELELDHEI